MENYEKVLNLVIETIKNQKNQTVPVGISNRHVHLSQKALEKLFGENHQLTPLKELSQPGQYACKECVTLCGPKGVIEKVRVLGPVRGETQVEILKGDSFKLGVKAETRLSGNLEETSGITLVGPNGSLEISRGVIVAQRHIHMLPEEAQRFNVIDGENVSIEIAGLRGGILHNVIIRAKENSGLECHIDTEEANALGINPGTSVRIIKK